MARVICSISRTQKVSHLEKSPVSIVVTKLSKEQRDQKVWLLQQRKTQTFDAILLLKKRAQFGRQHTHIKGIKNICNMENWISSQCFTFLPHEYVLPIAKRPSRVLKCSFGLSWKGSCRSSEKSIGKYQSIWILRKEEQSADVTL